MPPPLPLPLLLPSCLQRQSCRHCRCTAATTATAALPPSCCHQAATAVVKLPTTAELLLPLLRCHCRCALPPRFLKRCRRLQSRASAKLTPLPPCWPPPPCCHCCHCCHRCCAAMPAAPATLPPPLLSSHCHCLQPCSAAAPPPHCRHLCAAAASTTAAAAMRHAARLCRAFAIAGQLPLPTLCCC